MPPSQSSTLEKCPPQKRAPLQSTTCTPSFSPVPQITVYVLNLSYLKISKEKCPTQRNATFLIDVCVPSEVCTSSSPQPKTIILFNRSFAL